jgi:hypothetical protein
MANEKDVNITIRQTQKRVPISDFSRHDLKSKEGLAKLRLIDLRALVVKHNLHQSIRRYSVMTKSQIIDILHSHTQKTSIKIKRKPQAIPDAPPLPQHTYVKRSATPLKKKPVQTPVKPSGPATNPAKKLVPKRRQTKPKMTAFDKAMGIDKPMYSKAEGGLVEGAKKQFEKRYGKPKETDDAKFLKELGAQLAKENALGRGKRHKRKPAKLR